MADAAKHTIGTLYHFDLTVPNADTVRDFYSAVLGWVPEPLSMGDYDDYVMKVPDGETWVSGVCHARGPNADLPAQWLVHISVESIDKSLGHVRELGGKQLTPIKGSEGEYRYCVIEDPGGAVIAICEPPAPN
jgi:hypothetical protein